MSDRPSIGVAASPIRATQRRESTKSEVSGVRRRWREASFLETVWLGQTSNQGAMRRTCMADAQNANPEVRGLNSERLGTDFARSWNALGLGSAKAQVRGVTVMAGTA